MKFYFPKHSVVKKLSFIALTAVLVITGSLLQTNVLRVKAAVNVLLVSNTAIPFGNTFPGEMLDKTYTVQLDTSVNNDTYITVLAPVPGQQNLCPFLEVGNVDVPAEPDTLGSAKLSRPGDTLDNWRVRLTVPGIKGQISQNHQGQLVVTGGEYGCRITITTDTLGKIDGMKFNDLNRNRKKDPSEPGLPGWTIRLRGPIGNIVRTTVTDANGNYSFTNLPKGRYTVREVRQKEWKRMTRNPRPIVIQAGSVVTNINFGNARRRAHELEDTVIDDERDE